MENEISKSLQRYYKNKDIINKKQKDYYNKVYYPKNRLKLLEKSRNQYYKTNYNFYNKSYIPKIENIIKSNEPKNIIVTFN